MFEEHHVLLGHYSHTLMAERFYEVTLVLDRLDEVFVQLRDCVCHPIKAFHSLDQEDYHYVDQGAQR